MGWAELFLGEKKSKSALADTVKFLNSSQATRHGITFLTIGGKYHTLQTMAQLVIIRSR